MSDDKNPATITRQDIVAAKSSPHLFKMGSDNAVIYNNRLKRNESLITISDEALKELKAKGFTRVETTDGEAHSITFSNASGSHGVTIGVPNRAQFKWGDNGPIKAIENLREINKPASGKKAGLGLSEGIQLAEANIDQVEVPQVPNHKGLLRQV